MSHKSLFMRRSATRLFGVPPRAAWAEMAGLVDLMPANAPPERIALPFFD
jgi:hypothetical protein